MSSSQLTNSYFLRWWNCTTNQPKYSNLDKGDGNLYPKSLGSLVKQLRYHRVWLWVNHKRGVNHGKSTKKQKLLIYFTHRNCSINRKMGGTWPTELSSDQEALMDVPRINESWDDLRIDWKENQDPRVFNLRHTIFLKILVFFFRPRLPGPWPRYYWGVRWLNWNCKAWKPLGDFIFQLVTVDFSIQTTSW